MEDTGQCRKLSHLLAWFSTSEASEVEQANGQRAVASLNGDVDQGSVSPSKVPSSANNLTW
jgi:hypothetical protein